MKGILSYSLLEVRDKFLRIQHPNTGDPVMWDWDLFPCFGILEQGNTMSLVMKQLTLWYVDELFYFVVNDATKDFHANRLWFCNAWTKKLNI